MTLQRVIILTGEPPEAPGGVEHVVQELSKGLRADGFAVEVFDSQNTAPSWIAHPRAHWQHYSRDFLLSWYLGKRAAAAIGDDVAAIISNGPYGWRLPRVRPEIKKVHFYHGTYRGMAQAIRPSISSLGAIKLKWWDSMVLERSSGRGKCIVCNSDQTRDEVARYFGFQGQTVWLPLNTVHFAPMDKSEALRKLDLGEEDPGEDKKIGLFVGSTHPMKGFAIVRNLIGRAPNLKWIMALRGAAPSELRADGHIRVFENAPYDLLPALYNAADFAVFPSVYEPFGYVVAEALACGTPVITSPGGASRLFLSAPPLDFALMKQTASVEDYSCAIDRILADPELYRRKVIEEIRPGIENVMASSNWLRRFREVTGI
ncbi:MAG TPA: glycosyltransferase family 4 protein [Candidatus Acidoferrales bacterium]|nr:glycosyltransferase family 4 protein [Candidatus Acidoferrales bacterium]